MASKLFNARHELFAIMSFCKDMKTTAEILMAIKDVDYFATQWAREAYKRIRERYQNMEVSDGVLKFTSLIADDHLSEDTRERLESGRKRFLTESIDLQEVIESLRHYRKLRRLNELSEHINLALRDDDVTDPDNIILDIEEHLSETRSGNSNMADWFHHVGTEFNMQPVLERLMSDEQRGYVPTGIKAFDEKNSGINYGSLVTIAGSTGGGKCVKYDQVVPTSKGTLTVKELYDMSTGTGLTGDWQKLPSGITTLSHTGATRRITDIYRKRASVLRIDTAHGFPSFITKKHKLLVVRDGVESFIEANNMVEGDFLRLEVAENFPNVNPKVANTKGTTASRARVRSVNLVRVMTSELAQILGYMISDGSFGYCGEFIQNKGEALDHFESLIETVYGNTGYSQHDNGMFLGDCVTTHLREITGFTSDTRSADLFVPPVILRSTREVQTVFLRTLFEGDGYLVQDSHKGHSYMEYTSISEKLIIDVQQMLMNFGIYSSYRAKPAWATNGSENQVAKDAYVLSINRYSLENFLEIGFVSRRKQELLVAEVALVNSDSQGTNHLCQTWVNYMEAAKPVVQSMIDLFKEHDGKVFLAYFQNNKGGLTRSKRVSKVGFQWATGIKNTNTVCTRYTVARVVDGIKRTLSNGYVSMPCSLRKPLEGLVRQLQSMLNYVYVPISSIKYDGVHDVYDICVENDHSFVLGSVTSHNSLVAQNVGMNMAMYEDVCFPKGTPVVTPTGQKDIDKLLVGDTVLSYNTSTGVVEPKTVTGLAKHSTKGKRMVKVVHSDGEFICTEDHKIWVESRQDWIMAKDLTPEDTLRGL